MKLCPMCSTKNDNSAGFCKSCGANLAEVPVSQGDYSAIAGGVLRKAREVASTGAKKAQQVAADSAAKAKEHHQAVTAQKAEAKAMKQAGDFVDANETVQAALGTSFAQNMLAAGTIKQGSAILTEKRLYYKGNLFSGSGKNLISIKGAYIVPVENISMTSFTYGEGTGGKLLGFLLILIGAAVLFVFPPVGIVAALAGIISLVKFFLGKSTVFEISFPGGRFRFDVKWYPLADMQNFQRQIYLVKDGCNDTCPRS